MMHDAPVGSQQTQSHIERTECPICGGTAIVKGYGYIAPWVIELVSNEPEIFETRRLYCEQCEFSWSSAGLSGNRLAALYADYRGSQYRSTRLRYEPWFAFEKASKLESHDYLELRRERIKSVSSRASLTVDDLIVLDYGGDRGQYIPDFAPGQRNYLFDSNNVPAAPGVTRVEVLSEIKQNPPNFLIAAHVLEHMNHPVAELSDVLSLCDDSTAVYIEIPLDGSDVEKTSLPLRTPAINKFLRYLLSRSKNPIARLTWAVFDIFTMLLPQLQRVKYSEHLNFFSPKAVSALMEQIGYELVFGRTFESPTGGFDPPVYGAAFRKMQG